jgi:hypothetical protein
MTTIQGLAAAREDSMAKIQLESNRTFYLTLTSMIQSLAMGYLLTSIDFTAVPPIADVLQIVATFMLIVLVWHEYAISTMLFIWVVDLWDSLIPFVFGFTEVFMIVCVRGTTGLTVAAAGAIGPRPPKLRV